jgi:hypothetical protein
MNESLPRVIDQSRFLVVFGSNNQAEIFETIASHIKNTGDTVETLILGTGKELYQATVIFYTDDLSRLPMKSLTA